MIVIDVSMFFIGLSGPRSGLEGILELLEATWELLDSLGDILDAMIALLEAPWPLLDASWSVIRSPKRGVTDSDPPTALQEQPAGRGWGGDKSLSPGTGGEEGLDSKKYYPGPLHALRPEASADSWNSLNFQSSFEFSELFFFRIA